MSNPLDSINIGTLKADILTAIADVESLLVFVNKFAFLLPSSAKTGIADLQTVLNVVQSFLAKI